MSQHFFYKALASDGSVKTGELAAADRAEAFRKLDRQGLQPVHLEVGGVKGMLKNGSSKKKFSPPPAQEEGKAAGAGKAKAAKSAKAAKTAENVEKAEKAQKAKDGSRGPIKLKRSELVLFTEELSDLLGAGLQLDPALRIMENRDELGSLKHLARNLREKVRDGMSFSVSLRQCSPSFGDLYCNLAAAGEVSGALPTILQRQADYLITMQDLQSKVMFALIYPAFLVGSGIGVAVLFITFLIPKLTMLMESTGGEMPMVATLMVKLSDFLGTFWWLVAALIVITVMAFKWFITSEQYRPIWDREKLKLPVFGSVLATRFYVQFLETLANLLANGLPLLRGLELARNATSNIYLKDLVSKVLDYVAEGGALSRGLKRVGFFPSMLIDMVAVGEQTGDISNSLQKASERYDKELAKNIEKISALIQPVIILVMAVVVGVMAYFMISVIFDTISSVRARSVS
jgi:general secretion pathway protein F